METLTAREAALAAENTWLRQLLADAGLRAEEAAEDAQTVSETHAALLAESRQETSEAREDTRQAKETTTPTKPPARDTDIWKRV